MFLSLPQSDSSEDFGLPTAHRENPMLKKIFPKIYGYTVSPRKSSTGNAGGIFEWPSGNFHCGTSPNFDGFSTIFPSNVVITFLINMWNVFERPSRLRTTNYCEGWNNAWNMHTRSSPNIWLAIKFLKIQQKNTQNPVNHIRLGRLSPQKRKCRL